MLCTSLPAGRDLSLSFTTSVESYDPAGKESKNFKIQDLSFYVVVLTIAYLFRMSLLLGPPGSGKTSLLLALSGKLDSTLKVPHLRILS